MDMDEIRDAEARHFPPVVQRHPVALVEGRGSRVRDVQGREYIDLMADSIYLNSGRGCINCSGVWASRHTKEIAEALGALSVS